jgi:hypothetical protein
MRIGVEAVVPDEGVVDAQPDLVAGGEVAFRDRGLEELPPWVQRHRTASLGSHAPSRLPNWPLAPVVRGRI